MTEISELDAMKQISKILSQFEDSLTRDRILQWACSKFSSFPAPIMSTEEKIETRKAKKKKGNVKKSKKRKSSNSIVKNLDLNPSNEQTFKDFITEKKPSSNIEKSIACVYYLQHILKKTPITTNHVFTCFKSIGWRVPPDLASILRWVASQKGWLDTSNTEDIKVTTQGENLIEHDLPKKIKAK
jgi:hypothetical protein